MSASSPRTVLLLVKQPSWQVARACGASAKQASRNGMRRNEPKSERFIELFSGRVVVFINESYEITPGLARQKNGILSAIY